MVFLSNEQILGLEGAVKIINEFQQKNPEIFKNVYDNVHVKIKIDNY